MSGKDEGKSEGSTQLDDVRSRNSLESVRLVRLVVSLPAGPSGDLATLVDFGGGYQLSKT